ncbi:MAG: DUF374 domain-containing protein [Ignavibacteria bacterium]
MAFKFLNKMGLKILPLVIDTYLKTLRVNVNKYPAKDTDTVYIFWHSKMLIGWWLFRRKEFKALVSKSKDGDVLNNVLNNWNYKVTRGSSSRSGKEALDEIINTFRSGDSIVITPDGPRGPAQNIKNGPLIISNKLKLPIVPVRITFNNKRVLHKSWDKFEIPYPFSKCEVHFGEKHFYKNYLYGDELEKFKHMLSNEM